MPKLCVQLYSCCPVWKLVVVHLLRYVNIVIKRLLLLLLLLLSQGVIITASYEFAIKSSRNLLPLVSLSRNDSGQVVHMHACASVFKQHN